MKVDSGVNTPTIAIKYIIPFLFLLSKAWYGGGGKDLSKKTGCLS
jgi:hypothetical protein